MKKILIVEDQPEVRELVQVTLSLGGFEILEADSGSIGVALARHSHPDLILMDAVMPGEIDGFEATRRLRQLPELSATTILMLTARGQQRDLEMGRQAGADGYITKPFSPLALIKKVDEVLGQ
ncbi:response regulator transcription factor [Oceanidesulfovibrio marinus]|uniref:Response regulator n=1 Tax=Oceanidesulfovibrio marinus TaxID=370038 RepID=A0A6P1ZAW0_9BACT|nr:response regulator [Oceanidesulfovibrio marinus]QJT09645.1 response regulator [Oceanidesulfovibrio marinus]TVM31007.1 two-component system response regulator [Oceanidesulfovibrio marinus]